MATIPTPRSFNRIMGDMLNAFLSRFGIKSLRVGSPILALLEAAAQSDMRTSQDIFNLLNSDSLDRATGLALDRIGLGEDAPRLAESATTGVVTVSDTSFLKISTKIYQGGAAPIVGTTALLVADASSFSASGNVYLGRGTLNYEGPIAYSSKVNNGPNWTLTLSTGTQKFHNVGETVILAQGGNRIVGSGTTIQTPQGNTAEAVQFSVQYQAVIPDGETSITGVGVIAKKTGIIGNAPAGAVNGFAVAPFSGASVTNPLPFTNGQSAEDDTAYRERIKNIKQSRSKGTPLAIVTALVGITSTDENKRVLSASLVTKPNSYSTVFIDDGTGYEENSTGISQETIVDSALGGEQYLQLASKRPQAKAFVKTAVAAPYAIAAGAKLAVKVGGLLYTHTFTSSDFKNIGNATAFEVVASINANSLLAFSARTNNSGTTVILFAKLETNEDIEVTAASGSDANSALQFPLGRNDTIKLYKNDRLLSKDGRTATIVSAPQSGWASMSSGETLTIAVDGTATTTFTFVDADFVSANTGYASLASSNSIDAWVAVINAKIPGITAANTTGTLTLTSNAGTSVRAALSITGGTLVGKGMFTAASGLTATGSGNDYTFSRYTGQLGLASPLILGDTLAAGSGSTRAFVQSTVLGSVDITANGGAFMWFAVDGAATIVSSGLTGQTSLTLSTPSTNRVRWTAASGTPFTNIQIGDWAIFWDTAFLVSTTTSAPFPTNTSTWTVGSTTGMFLGQLVIIDTGANSEILTISSVTNGTTFVTTSGSIKTHASGVAVTFGNIGAWRIAGVTGTTIDMERTNSTAQSGITLPSLGLTFVRTAVEIQSVIIPPGLGYTPAGFVAALNSQLMGATASVYKSTKIRVATNTFGSTGDIAIVVQNSEAKKLGFVTANATSNLTSHIASIESGTTDFGTPTFIQQTILGIGPRNNITVSPPTKITSGSQIFGLRDKPVSLSVFRYNSTKAHNTPIVSSTVSGNGLTLNMRTLATSEWTSLGSVTGAPAGSGRVNFHSPIANGPNDNLTVIVDGDALTKRYTFNTYRRLKPASGTYAQTNAFKDLDNGTASLFTAFGGAFNFNDFAAYMKARVKTHDNTTSANLWRYFLFGPGGEQARMGYFYPSVPSASLAMTTDAFTNNTVDIRVLLPSGAARSLPNIRSTTGFGLAATGPVSGITTYWYILGYSISTASRTTNVVTATLTLPQGGTDPGLKVGDVLWFKDTSGSFGSSLVTIATVNTGTAQITFNLTGADVGATGTPGTVSLDSSGAEASFTGSSIVVGDIATIDSTATFNVSTATSTETASNGQSGTAYMSKTLRVNTLGNQFFSAKSDTNTGVVFSSSNSTLFTASNAVPFWRFLGSSATAIQFYPLTNNLSTQIATASQGLANAPIVATALGVGAAVTLASWEENATAPFWFSLTDSVNYLQSTANFPLDATTDYSFLFKDAINATLAGGSGCDWANEEIRIAPITVAGLVGYFNNTSITGLSTVASVQASTSGDKLTISSLTLGSGGAVQLPSGALNTATASMKGAVTNAGVGQMISQINVTDGAPFFGGMAVALSNTVNFVKTAGSTANFSTINASGVLDAQNGIGKLWSYATTVPDSLHGFFWQIEKQGKFVAIVYSGLDQGEYPDLSGVTEGNMVAIDTPTTWQTGITFNSGTQSNILIRPSAANTNGHFFRMTTSAGATGATEPVWPTAPGGTVTDNGIVWTEQGADLSTVSTSNQGLFRVVRVDNNATTLSGTFGIGTNTFNVASTNGFFPGMVVRFEPCTANAEFLTINTVPSTTQFTTTATSTKSHATTTIVAGPNKCIWIENVNAVEEIVAANITIFDYFASALAGDKINISLPALGTANIGSWKVAFPSYKHNFATTLVGFTPRNQYEIVLDTSSRVPVAANAANTPNGGLVQVQDSVPARLIKHIATISLNPTNSLLYDVKFTTNAASALVSAALGTVMSALDKLSFPTTTATGVDGYSYSTGLIGEAARVLYGDSQNPATYPGIVAAGSQVSISGPLVLRIQISLSIRVRTGVTATDVMNQVKSAVAGVINKAPIGQAIAISDIVNAAGNVSGVLAVSVISPTYNLGNDLISVQPYQKPLVQNLDTDVSVSIVG